jgi:CheY-like chemotaxis protein
MKKPLILLVEDTDSVREVITRQLQILGADVVALADGHLVKRELEKKQFDLVIADLHLPDCSGVDICRFAKAKCCKIILMSGDNNVENRPDLLNSQFDMIVGKPITMDKLDKILREYHLISEETPIITPLMQETSDVEDNPIDIPSLQEQMGKLDSRALEMLSRFPDMMRPLITELENAVIIHDMKRVAEIAHSLKGAARSAGALQLSKICEDIQSAAQAEQFNAIQTAELEIEFAKVDDALQKLVNS